jgi:hypothetical protein
VGQGWHEAGAGVGVEVTPGDELVRQAPGLSRIQAWKAATSWAWLISPFWRASSRYYVKRRSRYGDTDQVTTYATYPKVDFVVDCASHMILAAVPGRGPASDLVHFGRALSQAVGRARIGTLLADADFDAEWVHRSIRLHGIRSIIPPERGRPSEKPPAGRWRRRMKQRFDGYRPK